MKYTLKSYQETAVNSILDNIDKSRHPRYAKDENGDYQPVSFSLAAPTGAGKTVMMAAVIEKMLLPSDDRQFDPNTTILWLSDSPDLNDQSRFRIASASDDLYSRMTTVTTDFSKKTFDKGKVYFLNTQKLGKNSRLVRKDNADVSIDADPDIGQYTIWDTIKNTINNTDTKLYMIVDEAHRGSGSTNEKKHSTILRKIIEGHTPPNEHEPVPPIPVVLGVSATPGKFRTMMAGMKGERSRLDDVNVPTDEVQESGLIKDVLNLQIPNEDIGPESVQLRSAAKYLKDYENAWSIYHEQQGGEKVEPLLLVQLPDKAEPQFITDVVNTIIDGYPGELYDEAFANVLGEHEDLKLTNGRIIDYIEPQRVQDAKYVRVLLAKSAISTGWDCPRAEVMFSFRSAQDETNIIQVIGRMIRNPLAMRIPGQDILNSVVCILPKFNEDTAVAVANRINTSDDIASTGATTGSDDDNAIIEPELVTAIDNDAVWEAFDNLPGHIVPKRTPSPVKRLLNMGLELGRDKILDNGMRYAEQEMVKIVDGAFAKFKDQIDKAEEDIMDVQVQSIQIAYTADGESTPETKVINLTADNKTIDYEYRKSYPIITKTVAKEWVTKYISEWEKEHDEVLTEDDPELVDVIYEGRLRLAALAAVAEVQGYINREAETKVTELDSKYSRKIKKLSNERQEEYNLIRETALKPVTNGVVKPDNRLVNPKTRDRSGDSTRYEKHILTGEDDLFPSNLNSWEDKIISTEIEDDDVIAWYRNPSRDTPESLSIAYKDDDTSRWRSLQPDFIAFQKDHDGVIKPSIIDPHSVHLSDSMEKLVALAQFVEDCPGAFHEVLSITSDAQDDETLLYLDLTDDETRDFVLNAGKEGKSAQHCFIEEGSEYHTV